MSGKKKVIIAFDFEEYNSKEEAIERAKIVQTKLEDKKRIFVIQKEIPWPEKK
jgi:hypothetical protein